MNHAAFLAASCAEPPTAEHVVALEQDGWCVLPRVLDAASLGRLRAAFEAAPGARETSGTRHMEQLLGIDPRLHPGAESFEAAILSPAVIGAVQALLARPFRLLHFGGRDPLPGFGLQGLHTDWPPRGDAGPPVAVTALVLLDDFDAGPAGGGEASGAGGNGATRLVPGTHRLPGMVPRRFAQPKSCHPGEVRATGRAGDVLVFSAHLWHAGGCNESQGMRRVLQAQFVVRDNAPPVDADVEPGAWLSEAGAYLLG